MRANKETAGVWTAIRWIATILATTLLGAIVVGLGAYLTSYTDRIMPFYQVGAAAGACTGACFLVMTLASGGKLRNSSIFVPALLGALSILLGSAFDPDVLPLPVTMLTGLCWFVGTAILLRGRQAWTTGKGR